MVKYLLVKQASHVHGRVLHHSDPIKKLDTLNDARAYASTHSKDGRTIFIIKETRSSKVEVGYVCFDNANKPFYNDLGPYYWPVRVDGSLGKKEVD